MVAIIATATTTERKDPQYTHPVAANGELQHFACGQDEVTANFGTASAGADEFEVDVSLPPCAPKARIW